MNDVVQLVGVLKMRFSRWVAAAVMLSSAAIAGVAHATPVTETYNFNFGPFTGNPVIPYSNWSGSFTLTFDPAAVAASGTQTGTVTSLTSNISALTGPWDFVEYNDNSSGNLWVTIGNYCLNGGTNCTFTNGSPVAGAAVFGFEIGTVAAPAPNSPQFEYVYYSLQGANASVNAYSADGSGNKVSVPEPGTLVLLTSGLVLLTGLRLKSSGSKRKMTPNSAEA